MTSRRFSAGIPKRVFVSPARIQQNRNDDEHRPVFVVEKEETGDFVLGHRVVLRYQDEVIGTFVYLPERPLVPKRSGTAWFESTACEIEVLEELSPGSPHPVEK